MTHTGRFTIRGLEDLIYLLTKSNILQTLFPHKYTTDNNIKYTVHTV